MDKPLITSKTIQITSGRGPAECCWVVAKVLKLVLDAATNKGIDYIIVHREKGIENQTLQSVTVQLRGTVLETFLNQWIGTIQWIGVSKFRPNHKRKNWFIAIFEIKHSTQFKMHDKDVSYQATKSSGPGGQHVNKVSSAVRAIHLPTKTQILVMDSRSQHQNKKIAKQRLQEKVTAKQLEDLKTNEKNQWKNQIQIERGNPKKIFTGSDFKKQKIEKHYKKQRYALKTKLRDQLNN